VLRHEFTISIKKDFENQQKSHKSVIMVDGTFSRIHRPFHIKNYEVWRMNEMNLFVSVYSDNITFCLYGASDKYDACNNAANRGRGN
jgi:hypothetical protein